MTLKLALALSAALALTPLPALAQDTPTATDQTAVGSATIVDTDLFVAKVPSSNAFEIQSSRLALEKASDERIKSFAQMMIDDHTAAGERFAAVVQEAGLPAPGDALDERHQQMLETLSEQQDTFDQAYVQAQFQAHNEAVSLFGAYAQSGGNETIRAFAAETLPTLQQHLASVLELPGAPVDATSATTPGGGAMQHGGDHGGATPQP